MRVAIYFVPGRNSALWSFGSRAIGYDSFSGADCAFLPGSGLPDETLSGMTDDPRRYGFHGTLKPPFELAEGRTLEELSGALDVFAARRSHFVLPALEVASLGRFLALVPVMPQISLNRLAEDCVMVFDRFRAPLTEEDRARRLSRPLTPRQRAYVDRWGYPYVFEEFRFHMTLTGPLAVDAVRSQYLAFLKSQYAEIAEPVAIDGIALCRQRDRNARFEVVQRYTFSGLGSGLGSGTGVGAG